MAIDFNSNNKRKSKHKTIEINIFPVLIICIIFSILITLFFNKNVFAKSESLIFESNDNLLDIQNIIVENAHVTKFKEQIVRESPIAFDIEYIYNNNLPKGEEHIFQEGTPGSKTQSIVVTYENGKIVDQTVLNETITNIPTTQFVSVGTSEFLAKYQIHLNDTLYVLEDIDLKDSSNNLSNNIISVKQYLDVILLELLDEEWAKVSFDGVTGYIETSKLTSKAVTPDIVNKNQVQRALLSININMELNKKSNLSIDNFQKMLTNLPSDTNKIFENNYMVFYEMENKYNINGVFLAALAIHESGWGTSKIANDKKNLFGFGAYDSNPYEYAVSFETYSTGIESVAKHLVKQYLYPSGTEIYDGETAGGLYYNGPTLAGINTRYATDPDWYVKVFKHMQELYDRLN